MHPPPSKRTTIEKLLADPRYWNPKHPEHASVKAEATRAFRDANPETADATPTSTIHVRAYTRRQNGRIIQVSDYERGATIARHATTISPSQKGLATLRQSEGFRDESYLDSA